MVLLTAAVLIPAGVVGALGVGDGFTPPRLFVIVALVLLTGVTIAVWVDEYRVARAADSGRLASCAKALGGTALFFAGRWRRIPR